METIEVRYKKVLPGVYHKYFLYTDSNGNQSYARGGPQVKQDGLSSSFILNNDYSPFGKLVTETGNYTPGTVDWDSDFNDPSEVLSTGDDLSNTWNSVVQAMDLLNNMGAIYSGAWQNSNTAVDFAANMAGLPEPQLDDFGEYLSPGSGDTIVPSILYDDLPLLKLIPKWLISLLSQSTTARTEASPLVLDLDGDGIELTTLNGEGSVYWDIDQDGMAEASGWVAPDDGLLVLDRNSNGIIDDHSELFGTETTDGFIMLSELDSNGDGVINASDTGFENLQVWQDANSDGVSQSTELYSLADLGIVSINLNYTDVADYELNGNTVTTTSTYTLSDGSTRSIVDAQKIAANDNDECAADDLLTACAA